MELNVDDFGKLDPIEEKLGMMPVALKCVCLLNILTILKPPFSSLLGIPTSLTLETSTSVMKCVILPLKTDSTVSKVAVVKLGELMGKLEQLIMSQA